MPYPENQLWALALAGVITETNGAHHDALGGWGESEHTRPWCKNHLAKFYGIASPAELQPIAKSFYEAGSAWDTARLVSILGWSAWAGYIDEITAWQVMLMAGVRAQEKYDSWESFARAYEEGRSLWAEGAAHEPSARAIEKLLSDPASPWKTLPWNFDLGVKILDPNAKPRFKKTICPTCGAPKSRPSATAYVYCDHCGALADYDFSIASSKRVAPGPAYETLAAALAPKIEAARASSDRDAMRALQIELFDAWASACPDATPPRAREKNYREKYVAYLAEGAVVSAFDERARELDAALRETMMGLRIEKLASGELRVDPTMFRALFEAVLAREAHAAEIHEAHGVYAMQPDGASADLQKRMSMSMFAQGWLPMLDETTAKNMLTRLKLVSDYVEASTPQKFDSAQCGVCGADVAIAEGAKRMVCEHCGHKLDASSARVVCSGCGASLAPGDDDATTFACPHCKLVLRRVALNISVRT